MGQMVYSFVRDMKAVCIESKVLVVRVDMEEQIVSGRVQVE
jgi:hypothetical protein